MPATLTNPGENSLTSGEHTRTQSSTGSKLGWVEAAITIGLVLTWLSFKLLAIGDHMFFMSSLIGAAFLAASALVDPASTRDRLLLASWITPAMVMAGQANHFVALLTPHTIDASLMRLDHGIAMDIYRWARGHAYIAGTFNEIYIAIPLFGGVVLATSRRRMQCATAIVLSSVIATFFYYLFPAVGPAHIGDPLAARNCMPSLHLAWALLMVYYSTGKMRWATVCFALLTTISTLTTGEHYLVDLIAALPYSAAIVLIVNSRLLQNGWWRLQQSFRYRSSHG